MLWLRWCDCGCSLAVLCYGYMVVVMMWLGSYGYAVVYSCVIMCMAV